MTGTHAVPFFEREDDDTRSLPAVSYVAGLRSSEVDASTVGVTLPAELVERAVLAGARLSVWLSARSGRLILDGEGIDHSTLDVALAASPIREQTLLTLIQACLDPDHLSMEEDPIGDLACLREQLVEALANVDRALTELRLI